MSTWDGTGIEKRILSVHHPSTLVHGRCWFTLAVKLQMLECCLCGALRMWVLRQFGKFHTSMGKKV
jgi:hypothetical protein